MIIIRVQNLKSNIFKDINIEKYTFEDFEKTIAFYAKLDFIKYLIIRN